jgi:hypothetical protein
MAPATTETADTEALALATQQAREEIQREAEQKSYEMAEFEDARLNQPQFDRERTRRNIERSRRDADSGRSEFLAKIDQIIQRHGSRAGSRIIQLLAETPGQLNESIRNDVLLALDRGAVKYNRSRKIALFRAYGVPEVIILEHLAHHEAKNITRRNGPRDENEAALRAARQLLRVPLDARERPVRTDGSGVRATTARVAFPSGKESGRAPQ